MLNGVTNRQLVFLLLIILIAGSSPFIPRLMAESAGYGSWLTIIITSLLFAGAAAIIVKLGRMFDGKILAEYSVRIIGKPGGYLVTFIYLLYSLSVIVYLLISFSDLLQNNFLPQTPKWFLMLAGLPIFGYAAYKGITNIARMAEIVGILVITISILVRSTMFASGDIRNIQPFFNSAEFGRYLSAIKNAIIPFLGIEILIIIPFVSKKTKKSTRTAFLTVLAAGFWFIVIVEASVMMIGMEETANYTDPTVVAYRLVEVPFIDFLTRMDILYLTVKLAGFCVFLCIVYCAAVEFASRVLPRIKRGILVIVLGCIIFMLGILASGIDNVRSVFNAYAMFAIPVVAIIIPLMLLIIAKIRKIRSAGLR